MVWYSAPVFYFSFPSSSNPSHFNSNCCNLVHILKRFSSSFSAWLTMQSGLLLRNMLSDWKDMVSFKIDFVILVSSYICSALSLAYLECYILFLFLFRGCKGRWVRWYLCCHRAILWAWIQCTQDPCPQVLPLQSAGAFQMACPICRAHQMPQGGKCIHRAVHSTILKVDRCQGCLGLILTR